MNILAIDTSTDYLSLAVMKDAGTLGRFHKKSSMRHSSLLIPMIDRLLKKAGLKLKAVDGFCVSIGPGSFTGLRIGVTTVKGLAYCLGKPIAAVPTLDAIAHNAKAFKGVISPVLDARKNKIYTCLYKSDGQNVKKISGYLLTTVENLLGRTAGYDKVIFGGDAVEQIVRTAGPIKIFHDWHPRAEIVGRLGLGLFKEKRFVRPENLEPMYLYSKECDITGI